ncbi:YobI family P-loop NTPase [Virgibacillus sp. L01]|uniref:YobI family P-loop NTPase n=1 Tax=Virgibacillus sp. L01 TaxID=3457429 RepID=UPI003FD02FD2
MDRLVLESLAAKNKLDNDSEKVYLIALDEALKNDVNKNIAITGGYGAGKTTIIDAYFDRDKAKKEKMMRVSIASFQAAQENLDESLKGQNLLEQQILQQMFYQVDSNQVPNSKFTKISDLSFWYVFRILFGIFSIFVLNLLTINQGWINQLYTYFMTSAETKFAEVSLAIIILALLIVANGIIIYTLLMVFRKLGITRFGIGNTNIEFNFKDGSTVFNHYLDEIIYLFKKSHYRYIVFEDLDRFQSIKVFERLRGLNTILNSSASLKDRNIKFIYALKDDIFTHGDETESIYNRTKFFDFIIPTVKIMHSSNADSELLKKLDGLWQENENSEPEGNQKISKILIEDIALFINDMRTLINICNEFEIFRYRLQDSSITYNHLFAFVVYKNIYPEDYSNLLENKGIVYDVFNKKDEIVLNLRSEIQNLKNVSVNAIGSIITDKQDIAMLLAKKRKLPNKIIKQENNVLLSFQNSNNYLQIGEQTFKYILDKGIEGDFGVYLRDQNTLQENYSNVNEFVTINSFNYLKLYEEFEQNLIEKQQEIDFKIEELKEKIKHVQTKSISRLINEDDIELHINLSDKKLLYLLIRNNWLNESYEEHLTVFREGSISKVDNEFIKSIKLGYESRYIHLALKNPSKVAEKVRVDDINSIAVLNLSLIEFLLKNDSVTNNEKLAEIIGLLYHDLDQYFEDYIDLLEGLAEIINAKGNLAQKFLEKSLNKVDIWNVVDELDLSKEQKEHYVIKVLENGSAEKIVTLDSSNDLRDFISYELDVAKISDSNNLFEVLEKLEVKVGSLSEMIDSVMDRIIAINAYEINLENLRTIFGTETISRETIDSKPQVKDYCMSNIKTFITQVLLKQDNYLESERVFVNFIQYLYEDVPSEVEDFTVQSLIENWNGIVHKLPEVESFSLVYELYRQKKFTFDWPNIRYCQKEFERNENELNLNYILSNEDDLMVFVNNTTKEIQEEFEQEGIYYDFVNSVLLSDVSNLPKFNQFIERLSISVNLQEDTKVSEEIVHLLIENELLVWNVKIYNDLSSEYHRKKFVLDKVQEAEMDITELIEENELEWSLELLDAILRLENLDSKLLQKYIRENILKIDVQELTSIHERDMLIFDEVMLDTLRNEPEKEEVLIECILLLRSSGFDNQVTDYINEYQVPWDVRLFTNLRSGEIDTASKYLLENHDEIENVSMDQKLFKGLIRDSKNSKLSLMITEKYQNDFEVTSDIALKIYDYLEEDSDQVFNILSDDTIRSIITALPLEDASRFLLEYLRYKDLKRSKIYSLLEKLPHPFNKIKPNGKHYKIDSVDPNVDDLLSYLDPLQVISSYDKKEEDNYYLIRNKQRKKETYSNK